MDYFNARIIGGQGPKGAECYLLKKKSVLMQENVVTTQVVILLSKNTMYDKVLMA